MVSIKDYAKSKGVSYEAVRQQVNRYREELDGHVRKVSRTQYLDDEAVAFLDGRRQESSVILMQADKDEEIKRLQDENKALLVKVAELQEALIREKDEVKLLQTEKIALLEEKKEADQAQQITDKEEKKKHWWQVWKADE